MTQKERYPMVPMPQALWTVLQQTATAIVKQQTRDHAQQVIISLSNPSDIIGRISSETISAPKQGYPPYHASIMDGYAIRVNDHQFDSVNDASSIQQFKIVNRVHAGKIDNSTEMCFSSESSNDLPEAIYVTTGAVIPYPNYNAVVPIEDVNTDYANLIIDIDMSILKEVKADKWIRNVGCDISPNTVILEKGSNIEAVHIGLLLQCGITEVKVQSKPIVGILSTGNEIMSIEEMENGNYLQEDYQEQKLGMIPDANGPFLTSLLTSYQSCEIINYGIVTDDDVYDMTSKISNAIKECDVLITSGGVSKGEKDLIERVLREQLGCKIHIGRLHMKPGKPTTFATFDEGDTNCLIFAMPGNPVSAFVCTELLVRPCLDMLHNPIFPQNQSHDDCDKRDNNILNMVQNAIVHSEIPATLTNRVKLDIERPEYLRVTLSTRVLLNNDGHPQIRFEATSTGVQRSSRLMNMCNADGLMVMPRGESGGKMHAEAGESYPVLLLNRPDGNTRCDSFLNSIKLKDSLHYQSSPITVGIIEVVGLAALSDDGDEKLNEDKLMDKLDVRTRIERIIVDDSTIILENMQITSQNSAVETIFETMSNCLDIILVVCTYTSFQTNLKIAEDLRSCLSKDANALAFQVRKHAAYNNPLSALFEPVAGYSDINGKSCIILSLPNAGLENALYNLQGLLKKGISIVGGKGAT